MITQSRKWLFASLCPGCVGLAWIDGDPRVTAIVEIGSQLFGNPQVGVLAASGLIESWDGTVWMLGHLMPRRTPDDIGRPIYFDSQTARFTFDSGIEADEMERA